MTHSLALHTRLFKKSITIIQFQAILHYNVKRNTKNIYIRIQLYHNDNN